MNDQIPAIFAALLLASACGDSGTSKGDAGGNDDGGMQIDSSSPGRQIKRCEDKSGSRLKLRYYELPGGQIQPFGDLHDSDLDTACAPGRFADDVMRCYPSEFGGAIFYLDSGCTQPVIAFSPGVFRPYHRALTATVDGCDNNASFRAVDSQLLVDPVNLWRQNASCDVAVVQDLDYYSVGQPLALSNFEMLNVSDRPLGTRLGTQTMEGTDGSVICSSNILYDRDREESCRSRIDHNGVNRCIPDSSANIEEHFLASDCMDTPTGVVYIDGVCEASAPDYARELVAMECGSGFRLRNVGTTVTPYHVPVDTCEPLADGRSFFAIANNVAATQFVELSEHVDEASDRLRRIFMASEDDYGLQVGWYDSRFEVGCDFGEAEDGATRCLPDAFPVATYFADDACTESFEGAVAGGCADEAKFLSKPGMIGGTRILAAGDPITEPVYENPGCVEVELLSGEAVYPVDYEVSPTSFVEVEEAIDL